MDIAPRANVISGGSDTKNSSNRKKRKDPNAPKRASNAYMIFCKERRACLTTQSIWFFSLNSPSPCIIYSLTNRIDLLLLFSCFLGSIKIR